MNKIVIRPPVTRTPDDRKLIAALEWLKERDPEISCKRRHLREVRSQFGPETSYQLIVEGSFDDVDWRRPNYNVFHGNFKHEHVTSGTTWQHIRTFVDNYNGHRHKQTDQYDTFYIEDDYLAIEFKFFLSDL